MLKGRRAVFFEEWKKDKNATRAALRAGYSKKTARQQGSRLLKDPEIAAAAEEWRRQRHAELTAEADEVDEFLTAVMRGDEVDNIPLFVGDGFQEMRVTAPSVKDRLKAAELLGKRYGLFTDNVSLDGEEAVRIIYDIPKSEGGGGDAEA